MIASSDGGSRRQSRTRRAVCRAAVRACGSIVGPTSTSRSTRSGARTASSTTTWQPIELATSAGRSPSGPHLRRSLELLAGVFDYLDRIDVRVYRLSSGTVPYGTHPDLPELDYRRQIEACTEELAALGAKARRYGLR